MAREKCRGLWFLIVQYLCPGGPAPGRGSGILRYPHSSAQERAASPRCRGGGNRAGPGRTRALRGGCAAGAMRMHSITRRPPRGRHDGAGRVVVAVRGVCGHPAAHGRAVSPLSVVLGV